MKSDKTTPLAPIGLRLDREKLLSFTVKSGLKTGIDCNGTCNNTCVKTKGHVMV